MTLNVKVKGEQYFPDLHKFDMVNQFSHFYKTLAKNWTYVTNNIRPVPTTYLQQINIPQPIYCGDHSYNKPT